MSQRTGIVIGALVVAIFVIAAPYLYPNRRFDSAAWQDPIRVEDQIRIGMVDDLLYRHDFRGMTRADVVAMLGEPDKACVWGWDLVYWLGDQRGFLGIDSEWLGIRLGDNTKVTACELLQD